MCVKSVLIVAYSVVYSHELYAVRGGIFDTTI